MQSSWHVHRHCGSGSPPGFEPAGSDTPASGVGRPGRTVRRVLVVDDEPDLADLAAALLASFDMEATVAYNAVEALRILAGDPGIDAVFSDVMMPGMNGLQLADAIEQLYPSVRLVLTSGFTSPALMESHGRSYPWVAKPYRIEKVLQLLHN